MPCCQKRGFEQVYIETSRCFKHRRLIVEETPPLEFEDDSATIKSEENSENYWKQLRCEKSPEEPNRDNSLVSEQSELESQPVLTNENEQHDRSRKVRKIAAIHSRRPSNKTRRSSRKGPTAIIREKSLSDFWEANCIIKENTARGKYYIDWKGIDPKTNKPYKPSWVPYDCANEVLVADWNSRKSDKERQLLSSERFTGCQRSTDEQGRLLRNKPASSDRRQTRGNIDESSSRELRNCSQDHSESLLNATISHTALSSPCPVSFETSPGSPLQPCEVRNLSETFAPPPKVVISGKRILDVVWLPPDDENTLSYHISPKISLLSQDETTQSSLLNDLSTVTTPVLEEIQVSESQHTAKSHEGTKLRSRQVSGRFASSIQEIASRIGSSSNLIPNSWSSFETQVPYSLSQGLASQCAVSKARSAGKEVASTNQAHGKKAKQILPRSKKPAEQLQQPSAIPSVMEGGSTTAPLGLKSLEKFPTQDLTSKSAVRVQNLSSGHASDPTQSDELSSNERPFINSNPFEERTADPANSDASKAGEVIHYTPISLFNDAKGWYRHSLQARRNLLKALRHDQDGPSQALLKQEIRNVIQRASGVLTHPDLFEDERNLQALSQDPIHRAERNKSSSKFSFIAELMSCLKGTKSIIFLFARPGRLLTMIEMHLRDLFVPYCRPDAESSSNPRNKVFEGIKVNIFPTGTGLSVDLERNTPGQPNLIIGIDETFNINDPLVDKIRRHSLCPVVQLVVPYGAEHVSCALASQNLPLDDYLYRVITESISHYNTVGIYPDTSNDPRHLAMKIADAVKSGDPEDWKNVPKLSINSCSKDRPHPTKNLKSTEKGNESNESKKRPRESRDREEEEPQRPSPFNPAFASLIQNQDQNQSSLKEARSLGRMTETNSEEQVLSRADSRDLLIKELKLEIESLYHRARMLEADRNQVQRDHAQRTRDHTSLQTYLEERSNETNRIMAEAIRTMTEGNKAMADAKLLATDAGKKEAQHNQSTGSATGALLDAPSKTNKDTIPPNAPESDPIVEISSSELANLRSDAIHVTKLKKKIEYLEKELLYLKTQYQTANESLRVRMIEEAQIQKDLQYFKQRANGEISKARAMSLKILQQRCDISVQKANAELDHEKRHNEQLLKALDGERGKNERLGMATSTRASNSPFRSIAASQRQSERAILPNASIHSGAAQSYPPSNTSRLRG